MAQCLEDAASEPPCAGEGTLRVFCVSHEAPLVPPHLADYEVGIGNYHPVAERGSHIASLDLFWNEMRPYAYGAAGNYVIPKAIRTLEHKRLTGVFSHRKIVVRDTIGKRSPHSEFYYDIESNQAIALPRYAVEPRDGFDFLIGAPLRRNESVLAHYCDVHYGFDMFDYISMAVSIGILTEDEAHLFASEQFFVPGGCELGIYPTQWLLPVLERLERLGRHFVSLRRDRIASYGRYQVRVIGFLAERLGSFLLLTELRRRYPNGIPSALCGCLCVVVAPGETYLRAVGEDQE